MQRELGQFAFGCQSPALRAPQAQHDGAVVERPVLRHDHLCRDAINPPHSLEKNARIPKPVKMLRELPHIDSHAICKGQRGRGAVLMDLLHGPKANRIRQRAENGERAGGTGLGGGHIGDN